MLLNIRHETLYRYSHPVSYSIQHLRLTPRGEGRQRVLSWRLDAPGTSRRHIDAYGNLGHLLVLNTLHEEIRIVVEGAVDIAENGSQYLPAEHGVPLLAYLQETALTRADGALTELACRHLGRGRDRLVEVFDLVEAIRQRVAYAGGTSDIDTTAADALASGRGVCQDHAHVLLACCRAAGFPARYVSGYIFPGDAVHAASHAWSDVWIDGLGWVGVDVTHGGYAGAEHCRLAVGRDYLDACPVRGMRRGGGDEGMQVTVQVVAGQQ